MSRGRGGEASLFVGRLSKNTRNRDLEDIFEQYGRVTRCDIKYAYAFVDFEDRRDAEDAVKYENGRNVCGSSIIVEWAKGNPRRPLGQDECYKCHRAGHWARDCPDDRHVGYRRRRSPDVRRRSRSRSRDRKRRSRSRDRKRSRSRSRSRDRRRRSYSRSRSQSRSPSPAKNSGARRRHSSSRSPTPKRTTSQSKSPRKSASRSRSRSRS